MVSKTKLVALVDFKLGNDNERLECICIFPNSTKRVLKCQNLKVFEVVMTRWAREISMMTLVCLDTFNTFDTTTNYCSQSLKNGPNLGGTWAMSLGMTNSIETHD